MGRQTNLLAEVQSHSPADAAEERHASEIADLLATAPDAFARRHYQPGHITASCFIVDHAGRLLLHHHRRLNRWLQMGGHMEVDETPIAAALREGAEESGLRDLRLVGSSFLDLDVHAIPAGRGEPDHRHFDVRYLARTADPSAIAVDSNESIDLVWVELDRAAMLMNEEASCRVLRKIERWMGM